MPSVGGSDISIAVFETSLTARNTDHVNRIGVKNDPAWIADGAQANIWKQVYGADALFGVDLKLGASVPPVIREVDRGPNNQSATNAARNRAIRTRDKLAAGGEG